MSLVDATLLESYREPREVWIAARTDGVSGTGTQSDSYDGSARAYPSIAISSLSNGTGDFVREATVIATGHPFVNGEWVTISGVSIVSDGGATDNSPDAYYLGTFAIYGVTSNSFKYWMFGVPKSATAPGTKSCWRERELFDTLMRSMPANTIVHLGPGVFETKGMSFSVIAWEPKNGQKLRGSGIAVTTLKLVRFEIPEISCWAVGAHYYTYVEGFEISDLSVDCNVAGQSHPDVTCGAVWVPGKHIRIRRIRAINFGSHTRYNYVENFVIVSGAIHPNLEEQGLESGDCVIEDCILERPSPNPRWNSSMILLTSGEDGAVGLMAFHHACAIRNCFVNGQIIYGTLVPLPVQSIVNDQAASLITVTTKAPHQLTKPGNAVLRGVTVGGSADNPFNGVFEIDAVVSPTVFKFRLVTASTPDSGSGFVGGGVSTHSVSVQTILPDDTLAVCRTVALHSFDEYEERFRVTTRDPHNRTMFNNVTINGVEKAAGVGSAAFNGSFAITDYDPLKPRELICALVNTPDAVSLPSGRLVSAAAGVGHLALTGGGGAGAVLEGNHVFHVDRGVLHDTWATTDLVVRNNYFHDVLLGVMENIVGISTTFVPNPLVSLVQDVSTGKATSAAPHGLRVGDRVTISATGSNAGAYTGLKVIDAVPAPNRFEFAMTATPVGPASNAGYATSETADNSPTGSPIGPQKRLESLYYVLRGGKHIAIAKTTYASHGFSAGDAVRISKAGQFVGGSFEIASEFNGNLKITGIPNAKTFEYEISGDPSYDSENQDLAALGGKGIGYCRVAEVGVDSENENFSAGNFGRIWQVRNLTIENNVIELGMRTLDPSTYGWSTGIPMYGGLLFPSQFPFVNVHIRDNVIRVADDKPAPYSRGIEIAECQYAVVEGNVIDVDHVRPIEHQGYYSILTFNNTTPDGTLIESAHQNPNIVLKAPEVVKKIQADLEGAMSLSLFAPEEEL